MSAAEWPQVRSRFIFSRRDVRGADAPLASATQSGVILRDDLDISVWNPDSDVSNYKLVEDGDFVIGLRSFQHGISHSEVRGIVSPAYTVLRGTEEACPEFFKYYFRSSLLISHLANLTQGIRQGQAIDIEAFANLELPVPPLDEQRRIAGFLDVETSRIDALAAARGAQLRCLEQRWKTRLAETANGLIDSYGLLPLRRFVASIEQGWSPQCDDFEASCDEWAVLKTSSVSSGKFKPREHKRLPNGVTPEQRYQVKDGDILMTRGSGSPSHVGVSAVAVTEGRNLLLSDLLYRVRLDGNWAPDFVTLMLASSPVRGFMSLLFRGQSGQTIKLRSEDIRAISVPATPPDKQAGIASELQAERDAISQAQDALSASNALLAERRQALITAAVTGRFDVTTAGRSTLPGGTA
ncbi:restriction endonuclease subunit S [Streptomyces sp. NPDC060334]|uniref:restriction endonuclease subunit S n=1 Tax=Streptomyces sp. NPDC060334 TaxID=3347099 RepID=UPI003652DDAC